MATHKFGEFYEVDENYDTFLREGYFVATIEGVERKESKAGKPMIVITFLIDEINTIKYFLVDDLSSEESKVWSNRRLTKFFDCFKIQRGDFNLQNWLGSKGHIYICKGKEREDGRRFFEVKRFFTSRDIDEWKELRTTYCASCLEEEIEADSDVFEDDNFFEKKRKQKEMERFRRDYENKTLEGQTRSGRLKSSDFEDIPF